MRGGKDVDHVILATGGYDHTIRLWQTHTGICIRSLQHPDSQVNRLEISPDKQLLVSGSYQHIYMYDLLSNNASPIATYDGPTKNVTGVLFQSDGRLMYSSGEDRIVRMWDIKSKSSTQCVKMFDARAAVTSICLHPNEVEMFVGDQSGVIHRWDLKTDHNEQVSLERDSMILDIDIDPQGTLMAAVNSKGRCYTWNLKSGKADEPTKLGTANKFDAHARHVLRCKFSPDSRYLVTTSADQTARIWNTSDFSLRQELKQDSQRWVWDAAFSADSQYVFTASSDGYAKLWNVETGKMEKEYAGHQKPVTALAFKDSAAT